jgi:hypothetical protein
MHFSQIILKTAGEIVARAGIPLKGDIPGARN